MGEVEKKLKGISRMLLVLVIAAIIIIAAVVGAYWWFYHRPSPAGISLSISPCPTGVEASGGYAEPGEDITISGSTSPVIADATVTLTCTKPDGSNFTRTTTTDSGGKFTDTYSSDPEDPTGKWTVTAEIEGETSDPAAFYIFVGTIKIGVIGPMDWIQGKGQVYGAIMVAEEVNDASGVLGRKIVILKENDGGEDQTVATLAIARLAPKVDFLMGGFRTETVFPIREGAMDEEKIFFLTGSATTELIDCWKTPEEPCGKCVRCNYDRYKYLFRVTPPNATAIFTHVLVPYVKYHLIPKVMLPQFGKPIKVAVVIENAQWTAYLRGLIADVGAMFYTVHSPYDVTDITARIVYESYPSPAETDFSAVLEAIKDSGAHLIVHVFSAKAGQVFITQWGERKIPAIPIGVNVLAQEKSHWEITGEKCEYEATLSAPPRINASEATIPFWDAYVERWGDDPIYTAFGTFDAMHILTEAIERAGELNNTKIVEELEKTHIDGVASKFRFTKTHDVFVENTKVPRGLYADPIWDPDLPVEESFNIEWLDSEYTRALLVQWQDGERVILFPFNEEYTGEIKFPPWM